MLAIYKKLITTIKNGCIIKKVICTFHKNAKAWYSVKKSDYKKNVKKAKKLLAEAGYPDGKGLKTLEISFNTNGNHQPIAEAVQNMWKTELGVNAQLRASSPGMPCSSSRTGGSCGCWTSGCAASTTGPSSTPCPPPAWASAMSLASPWPSPWAH